MFGWIDWFCQWWPHWRMRQAIQGDDEFSEFTVNKVEVQERGIAVSGKCPAFMAAITEGAKLLQESGAANFLEYKALIPGIHPPRVVLVTIQWADRLSPAQKIDELKAEIERLKKQGEAA